jgi:hypothetical protein
MVAGTAAVRGDPPSGAGQREKRILSLRRRRAGQAGNCQGFTFSAVPEPNARRKHKPGERGCTGLPTGRTCRSVPNRSLRCVPDTVIPIFCSFGLIAAKASRKRSDGNVFSIAT